jgi:hypothetical protein
MRNDLPEDWMLNASCAEIEYQIGKYFRRFVDQCVEIETIIILTIVIIKGQCFFIHKALDVMYLLNTSIVTRQDVRYLLVNKRPCILNDPALGCTCPDTGVGECGS